MADNNVESSLKLINWLFDDMKQINQNNENVEFKQIIDVFLQGNTVLESLGYIVVFHKTMKSCSQLGFEIKGMKENRHDIVEILPHPNEKDLEEAQKILTSLGIDGSIATTDIYLENQKRANKFLLEFVLGE